MKPPSNSLSRSGSRTIPPRAAVTHGAFTLVELLVVLAILAVLASLLAPALGRATGKARSLACVNNLRQLGIAVRTYAEDHAGVLPQAELLPSVPTVPAAPLPRIADVLAADLGRSATTNPAAAAGVFRCPADRVGRWQREGSSYEWNTELNGRRLDETRNAQVHIVKLLRHDDGEASHSSTNFSLEFPPTTTPLLYDYEAFHPRPPRSGKNAVFMDGHVESLDAMLR